MRPFIGALMLVLWLAPSAWAIPSQYILNSDASGGHTDYPGDVWSGPGHGNVGTVTFDSSLTIPFVSWDIEIRNRFSNLIDEVGMNGAVVGVPTEFRLATHNDYYSDSSNMTLNLDFAPARPTFFLSYDSGDGPGWYLYEQGVVLQTTPVPELPTGGLVMIGLLVLAGSRWWTVGQERRPPP